MRKKEIVVSDFFKKIRMMYSFPGINGVYSECSYDNLKRPSKWSNCLTMDGKRQYELDYNMVERIIAQTFDSKIQTTYRENFRVAASGAGSEWKKMTTLHSSSLLSFLHFYRVNSNNPVIINIDGKPVKFNFSLFEVQNPCVGSGKSSMDVVLISESSNIILFLESKCAEYLSNKSKEISKKYVKKYKEYFGDYGSNVSKNITYDFDEIRKKVKFLTPKDYHVYTEGIIQMISHFISLENFMSGTNLDKTTEMRFNEIGIPVDIVKTDYKILLGEILFDFDYNKLDAKKTYLTNYGNEYLSLRNKLNRINPKVSFLDKVLIYQRNLKYSNKINNKIKEFYNL